MILVRSVLTADNADVLDATDLANIPGDGMLTVYAASTQNDTLMTITGPGSEPVVRARALPLRTNGQPLISDDVPLAVPVIQGGHYVINIDVVTAATVVVVSIYYDMGDLGFA